MIKVDFPEPDTPVTQTNKSKGSSRFTFFKLCPVALVSFIILSLLNSFLFFGIETALFPERYSPVIEFFDLAISLAVP